jgi:hypothetical protein
MKVNRKFVFTAAAVLVVFAAAPLAHGALMSLPVVDWAVHNQSTPPSVITNGNTNSPTFTPADQALTVMGTFRKTNLENDGDYIELHSRLLMSNRFGNTGVNALNTALRIGLFNGPDAPVGLEDAPNRGVFIVYNNSGGDPAANRRIRQQATGGINPFSGTDNIGAMGSDDAGGDSIRGANPGPVDFTLKLTRNNDAIDISARISGTDSVTGNPYISDYAHIGYVPGVVGFEFDRAGFFFANNVDAPSATLEQTRVLTNVPEPTSVMLAASALLGGVLAARRRRRVA